MVYICSVPCLYLVCNGSVWLVVGLWWCGGIFGYVMESGGATGQNGGLVGADVGADGLLMWCGCGADMVQMVVRCRDRWGGGVTRRSSRGRG